jgi:hypothetical protein
MLKIPAECFFGMVQSWVTNMGAFRQALPQKSVSPWLGGRLFLL